jgi:plasmid stabilization system protein ParE
LAIQDLECALDYIHSERASAAEPVLSRIEASLETLSHHPELGRAGRVGGTRELLVMGTPFLLAYRKKADRLEILAIIHGALRWPENF